MLAKLEDDMNTGKIENTSNEMLFENVPTRIPLPQLLAKQ
jgi:hypothetical protein